jgi:hypothetical protein
MWRISSGHAPHPTASPPLHVLPVLLLPQLLWPSTQLRLLGGSMPAAAAAICSSGSGTEMRTPQMDALLAAAAGMAMPHLSMQ